MKKIYLLLIIAILILITEKENFAQLDYGFDYTKSGTAGLQFLKIGIGAKETAMGEAVTSLVNDANSVFWNPSGISYVENYQVSFSYNSWLAQSKHSSAVFAFPYASFVFAICAVVSSNKGF